MSDEKKRIKIPGLLKIKEQFARWNMKLDDLHGKEEMDWETGSNWKFDRDKGWIPVGRLSDMTRKTPSYYEIADASEEVEEKESIRDAKVDQLLNSAHRQESKVDQLLNSAHRQEQDQEDLKALFANSWNYTMLSFDNRVLKIGETRWDKEPNELKAELEKRYRQKKERAKGGPFRYVSHKPGTDKTEAAALTWLDKCGVKPLHGEEYFHSHEALKGLRIYGSWCLGEWGTEDGFLPAIEDAEQGNLWSDL